MNAIVKTATIKTARAIPAKKVEVQKIIPQDNAMYWIVRTTASNYICEPEIAMFKASVPGRSFYTGKWQIFDKMTPIYNDESKVRVLSKIPVPAF